MRTLKRDIRAKRAREIEITDEDLEQKILPTICAIGAKMAESGADINHCERLVEQLGYCYGADRVEVLVFSSAVICTLHMPDGKVYSYTRRIRGVDIDFYMTDRLNKLCRSVKHVPKSADDLIEDFYMIIDEPKLRNWDYAGSALVVAGYTAFFGGNAIETLASIVFAVILCTLIRKFQKYTPTVIGFNFIASFIMAILIGVTAEIVPWISPDSIISGVIMIIIPGLMWTNSIRDMLSGDTLAGVLRFIESTLSIFSMVFGISIALKLIGCEGYTDVPFPGWGIKMVAVFPCTIGLLLFFNARRTLFTYGLVGALATFASYIIAKQFIATGEFVPVLIAGIVASAYSEIFSKRRHVPSAVFFVVSIMPLIPGRLLFGTMNYIVQFQFAEAGAVGNDALMTALGIAVAICVVWTISRTWRNLEMTRRLESVIH